MVSSPPVPPRVTHATVRRFALAAVKRAAVTADGLHPKRRGVVVLIYHRVGRRTAQELDLATPVFDMQMAELAASGRVTTLDGALASLGASERPVADPVVVTFDDGTADFADEALPVLVAHGVPATLYVATDFVERGIDFPGGAAPLSWAALADARATGLVTVGSHTHTHALLDRLPPERVADELDRSIGLIEDHLGTTPAHFAYPKAVPGSAAADAAVRARFRSAALAGTRPNRYGATDPYRLARSPIQHSDGLAYFRRKAAGGMVLEDHLRRLLNRRRYSSATT